MGIKKIMATLGLSVISCCGWAEKPAEAILFVHYGTTSPEMRERSLNAINEDVKRAFPEVEFMEAYTSPVVIKALGKRGEKVPTPMEALMTLRGKGVEKVVVQSSMLMNGGQTEYITLETEKVRPFFSSMNVGKPLLYTISDSRFLVDWLATRYHDKATEKGDAVVFVGHGGDNPGTAIYSQLGDMFAEAPGNYYVSTIEGYPDLDNVSEKLKMDKIKNVTLVPLLIVGGNHIRKDIDGEWKTALEKQGFNVSADVVALGEQPEIREWIVNKVKNLLEE